MITANREAQKTAHRTIVAGGVVRVDLGTGSPVRQIPILAVPISLIQQSHVYRGMRSILREICNLYHRIQRLREIHWGLMGVGMDQDHRGKRYLPKADLLASTHARMRGIEYLYSIRPYSTLLDVEVFLLGWVGAEEIGCRPSGIQSKTLYDKQSL